MYTKDLNIKDRINFIIQNYSSTDKVPFFDLGTITYNSALDLQLNIFDTIKDNKLPGVILLLEHNPVITIGNNKNMENILSNKNSLKAQNIELVQSNRGGDVTFHGPGQLVCYPVFNLARFEKDLGNYVHNLEQIIINVLENYDINGHRINKIRGVFVDGNKIASVGIHVKKWVTLHGFSFNINVNLDYFKNIIACGLKDYKQTSMQKILGKKVPFLDVKELVLKNFINIFNIRMIAGNDY